jgi:hypothetical protein
MKKWIASLALGISASAQANVITIDADNYAVGTNVSTAIEGASLWSYSQAGTSAYSPIVAPISVVDCSYGGCGPRVFGNSVAAVSPENFREVRGAYDCQRGHRISCVDGFQTMQLVLDAPTDFVSIETEWLTDHPGLYAFNAAGTLLFSCLGLTVGPCSSTTTALADGHRTMFQFSRDQKDVARVMFGGVYGANRVSSISVSVPEPTTLALLGVALAGAVVARRRKATGEPLAS